MPIYESISKAEIVAWLGLIGGFFIALVKAVRWVANFSEEHTLLMAHFKEVAPLVPRIITMEETTRQAKEERKEMLEEIRGLRQDMNDLYTALIKRSEDRA